MDSPHINESAPAASGVRQLLWIAGLFAASLLLGGALAGPVFNVLLWLGRNVPSLEALRDVEFERVASRCVLIILLAAAVPVARRAGIRSARGIGFAPGVKWGRLIGAGFLAGVAATAAIFTAGLAAGAYDVQEMFRHGAIVKSAVYLAGALLVGLIEEGFFRGVLFGALRRSVGFWGGVAIAGVIYSAVHFAKPRPPAGVVYGHVYSGIDLIPHMFNTVDMGPHFFPLALTLFLLSVVLCALYQRTGSLYVSIGFHAGLVWVMRIGGYFLERNEAVLPWLFSGDMVISKSWIALFVVGGFTAGSLWLCRGRGGVRS